MIVVVFIIIKDALFLSFHFSSKIILFSLRFAMNALVINNFLFDPVKMKCRLITSSFVDVVFNN